MTRGCHGVAIVGLTASITNLIALVGDWNIRPEVTRRLSSADGTRSAGATTTSSDLIGLARHTTLVGGLLTGLCVAALAPLLSTLFDMPAEVVLFGGLGGWATLVAQQEFAILSGLQRIPTLTWAIVMRSLAVTVAYLLCSVAIGAAASYTVGMVAGAAATRLVTRSISGSRQDRDATRSMRRLLITTGSWTTATAVAYVGVRLAMPTIVSATSDARSVGFFVAGIMISGAATNPIITTVVQDYFPRVAAHSISDAADLISAELNTIGLALTAAAAATIGTLPISIPIVFGDDFSNATSLAALLSLAQLGHGYGATLSYTIYGLWGARRFFLAEAFAGTSLAAAVVGATFVSDDPAAIGVTSSLHTSPRSWSAASFCRRVASRFAELGVGHGRCDRRSRGHDPRAERTAFGASCVAAIIVAGALGALSRRRHGQQPKPTA